MLKLSHRKTALRLPPEFGRKQVKLLYDPVAVRAKPFAEATGESPREGAKGV